MRKIFLFSLALLLFVGVANAANIPVSAQPKDYPEIWTVQVYNNSGSALTSGSVVVWDNEADTADASYAYRTMWITTTTTQDDVQVAGVVVSDSIAAGDTGAICIWGPVYARIADSSAAVTAADLVSAYSTAGLVGDWGGGGADEAVLGYCLYASPVSTANGGYGGTDGNNNLMMPIFVDISRVSDD